MALLWALFLVCPSSAATCTDGTYYNLDSDSCLDCEQLVDHCALCVSNIVENGSFESPSLAATSEEFSSVPGWTPPSGRLFELTRAYSAQHGSQIIDLAGSYSDGLYSITQELATLQHRSHTLSFYYSGNPGGIQLDYSANAYLNGQLIADLTEAQPLGTTWELFSYTFVGTGSDSLVIEGAGLNTGEGMLIDNVQVIPAHSCTECSSGYFINLAYHCELCSTYIQFCEDCSSATQCDACASGYYLNDDSTQCCSSTDCLSCPSGTCVACRSSYYLASSTCEPCAVENCSECTNQYTCAECQEGFTVSSLNLRCCDTGDCSNCAWSFDAQLSADTDYQINIDLEQAVWLSEADLQISVLPESDFTWTLEQTSSQQAVVWLDFAAQPTSDIAVTVQPAREVLSDNFGCLTNTPLSHNFLTNSTTQAEIVMSPSVSTFQTAIVVGAIAGLGFLQWDFSLVWLFLNTAQILAYIPLGSTSFSQKGSELLVGLGQWNTIPNIPELTLDDNGKTPYREALRYGYTTTDFVLNSGKDLSVGVLLVIFASGSLLISEIRACKSKCTRCTERMNKYSRWGLIRFWVQFVMVFDIHGLIQLSSVSYKQSDESGAHEGVSTGLAIGSLVIYYIDLDCRCSWTDHELCSDQAEFIRREQKMELRI